MQAYYNVLTVSDSGIYDSKKFDAIQNAVKSGNEVPEELRDELFSTALSELEKMVRYMIRSEPECSEPQTGF